MPYLIDIFSCILNRSICTTTSTTTCQPTRTCDEDSSPNFKYKATDTCKDGYPKTVGIEDSDTTPSPKQSVIVVSGGHKSPS
ncbi:13057_t:CDS:1, partial [Racocetra fulgida]